MATWSRLLAASIPASANRGCDSIPTFLENHARFVAQKVHPVAYFREPHMNFTRAALASIVVMVLTACVANAQTSQGRILGRVTDSSGAVVANAMITILDTSTGLKRVLQTNTSGDYV